MARIAPFFRCDSPATARQSAAPGTPGWYPFHNDDRCPIGQELKSTGAWQDYEPTRMEETRPRCPLCIELDRASAPRDGLVGNVATKMAL